MSNYFDDDDTFWDGPGQDSDRTAQIDRVRGRSAERTRTHHIVRRERPLDDIDDGAAMWVEPTARVTDRLGPLGSVDPRVLSVGAVALAVVLAVPLFGALGDDGSGDALRAIDEQTTTTVATVAAPATDAAADVVVVTAATEADGDAQIDGGAASAESQTQAADADTAANGGEDAAAADEADDADQAEAAGAAALDESPDCANQYTAAAGDYWLRIADGSGTSLDSLLEVNEASAETPIYPGSTICLPDDAAAPAAFAAPAVGATSATGDTSGSETTQAAPCQNLYASVAGDYWLRISEAAGIGLDELLDLNDATVDTPLYPGSEVCLPAGASGPVAPTTALATTQAPVTTQPPSTTAPPTTAAPTTEQATTVPPAPPPPAEIEQIIRNVWPDDLEEQALRIAWRESSYNPRAQNFCCSGLFQIYYEVHASWLADLGVDSVEDLYDPLTNATAAYALYQRSGSWEPWRMTAD